MSLLYFIVIGLIAGWLAAKLIRGGGFGRGYWWLVDEHGRCQCRLWAFCQYWCGHYWCNRVAVFCELV